jgi:hypothetical protein
VRIAAVWYSSSEAFHHAKLIRSSLARRGKLTSKNSTAGPNPRNSPSKAIGPVGSHGRLSDLQWLFSGLALLSRSSYPQTRLIYLSQSSHPGQHMSVQFSHASAVWCWEYSLKHVQSSSDCGGQHTGQLSVSSGWKLRKEDLRNKLLNLTGFFSSGAGGATRPAGADIIWEWLSVYGP